MKLIELLNGLEYELSFGNPDTEISALVTDSRKIVKDCVFVCISGAAFDGHSFAQKAIEDGAAAVVAMHPVEGCDKGTFVIIKDTRKALAFMSANWFSHPSRELITIGITGTKGKTTSAYMVQQILEKAGIKTGLIGTVETIIGEKRIPSANTTPESYLVQKYFREMADAGCKAVVMEVSSQGLKLSRVDGFTFDYGVFTNLEPDHIGPNEHADFEEYAECKALLFQRCRVGIFNYDDACCSRMMKNATCEAITYGCQKEADVFADRIDLHHDDGKMMVSYMTGGKWQMDVDVCIPGIFTVYNSLMALTVCKLLNVPDPAILDALKKVQVKGRLETVPVSNRFSLMIDYAHNAMSLKSLLKALLECHPKRLVCLFGCGGNRSRDRRFEMGEISSQYADLTIVTSDNPRFEKPEDIIADILVGVQRANGEYITIPDRKEAIRYAILNAKEGDLIVLAGKGHEDYQEICGVKHPMDERVLIREIVSEMTDEERKACGLQM